MKSVDLRRLIFIAHLFYLLAFEQLFSQVSLGSQFSGDSLHPQYHKLEARLRLYESIIASGAWQKINTEKDSLKQTKKSNFIFQIKKRLEAEGYLTKDIFNQNDSTNLVLEKAIKCYQKNNGIDTTGFPGPVTIASMNVPAEKRYREIQLNMQRWKLMGLVPNEYILVNIPDFKMMFVQNQKIIMSMKVVVGKSDRQTPQFREQMTYLVLNPSWNIPQNVLKKDVIGKIKKDPDYLSKSHMLLYTHDSIGRHVPIDATTVNWNSVTENNFPFDIEQLPGTDNALGKVKFVFPNKYSVYMHDTPAKALFLANEPMFSSGCIRLSDAQQLADFLLLREGWTEAEVHEALQNGKTLTVVLKEKTLVIISYFTVWVDDGGELQFRKDVYNKNN